LVPALLGGRIMHISGVNTSGTRQPVIELTGLRV